MKIKTKKIISAILFAIMTLCCLMCALKVTQVKADVSYTVGNALTADEYNIRGGSIKYNTGNNDNGMRIHIRMAASYYSALGSKEAGVLIIPEYDLGENQLDYNTDNVLNVPFIAEDFNAISSPTTGESASDKEVLTSLIFRQNGEPVSSKIYNAVFCVRGYVIDGDTIRYTPVWKKAIADVALAFIDDPSQSEHSEELNGYLNTYQVKFFEEDGTTQIGETQNVKYGSTFDVEEPEYASTQYIEYNRKQSNGTFTSEEYDFDATDATVVKKNMHFKATVQDRTITYGAGITVKDSSGNSVASGTAVESGDYNVTVVDNDKKQIAKLCQDGEMLSSDSFVMNGEGVFGCSVDKATELSIEKADIADGGMTFSAVFGSEASHFDGEAQGYDGDDYLCGPAISYYAATPEIRMNYNSVFTTSLNINDGYGLGVRFLIGSMEYRVMVRPWFRISGVGDFRPNYVRLTYGTANNGTELNSHLKEYEFLPCTEAEIKLIFDDINNRVYVLVNGCDFSGLLPITYQPTESTNYARVQLLNCCEDGKTPAQFKTWSVNAGEDVVAKECAHYNSTDFSTAYVSYNGAKVSTTKVASIDVLNDGTETMYRNLNFNVKVPSTAPAGFLIRDNLGNYFNATFRMVGSNYRLSTSTSGTALSANAEVRGKTVSSATTVDGDYEVSFRFRQDDIIYIYLDDVVVTAQGFSVFGLSSDATRLDFYLLWTDNGTEFNMAKDSSLTATYNSSDYATSTYVTTRSAKVSSAKVASIDVLNNGTETFYDFINFNVKVPSTSAAGILVKDNTGAFFVAALRLNGATYRLRISNSATDIVSGGEYRGKDVANVDGEYQITFRFRQDDVIFVDIDGVNATGQGFTNLGLSADATRLDFFLVWTENNTEFTVEQPSQQTFNSSDVAYTTYTEGYNVATEKLTEITIQNDGSEDIYDCIDINVKVPSTTAAGLLIKDDLGNYFSLAFRQVGDNYKLSASKSGIAAGAGYDTNGANVSAKTTVDDDYRLTIQFRQDNVMMVYVDNAVVTGQNFVNRWGISGSATKLEIYLLWTAADTEFAI